MERILNAKEFAAVTRVSLQTACAILRAKKVRAVKTGREWKILESEVQKFLRGEVVGGGKIGTEGQTAQQA
jgi:excisionase family DNA binding protein